MKKQEMARINFVCKAEEMRILKEKAEKMGLSLSAYLRLKGLEKI